MSKIIPTRDQYELFYSIQTRWADNDIYGHVNNVTYYAYFDSVINRFLIEKAQLDIHAGPMIGFIVQSQCAYYSPVAFPEVLQCGFRVTRIGNSSVEYSLAIFKENEQKASALGGMTHVFVSSDDKKPITISGHLKTALQALLIKELD
jgi:acyl-CoA thioester hydrolase